MERIEEQKKVCNQWTEHAGCVPGTDWRSEGMGTQEGCRDGPVGDAPSGGSAAWGVFCWL